jgi:hypothetical protein
MRETPLQLLKDILELQAKHYTLILRGDIKTSLSADKTPRAEIWPFLESSLDNNAFQPDKMAYSDVRDQNTASMRRNKQSAGFLQTPCHGTTVGISLCLLGGLVWS